MHKKRYEGTEPKGEGWKVAGEWKGWQIWLRKNQDKPEEWPGAVKVISLTSRCEKANFCFGWSINFDRFVYNKDSRVLAEYYPDLAEAVTEIVKAAYGS